MPPKRKDNTVGGLISWKQTTITVLLQKGTDTSSASNERKTSAAQPSSAGPLRVDCAGKH
jgi:hypothetical protein